MPRRSALLAPMIAMALAIVAVVWLLAEQGPGGLSGAQKQTTGALVGGPFELVDHTGRAVTDEDFRGRFLLVYFGFTTCPDVCPTALQEMTQALDLLGGQGNEIQPLLVTIDPERDTPAVLADYVAQIHPRLIGLTGSAAQIKAVADGYKVFYAKAESDDGDYLMDHTSILYLLDREGRYAAHFGHDIPPDDLAKAIQRQLDAG